MIGSRNTDAAFARRCRPTTVWRAFVIAIGFGAGFSVLGGALGSFIGRFAPTYYRTVFAIGRHEAFDPVEMGIGLGLNQGWGVGLVVGLVVVGVFAWKDYWLDKVALAVAPQVVRRPERTSALLVLVVVLGILASIVSGFVAWNVGVFQGEWSAKQRLEDLRQRDIAPILVHPDYSQLKYDGKPIVSTVLFGTVPSQDAKDDLREKLVTAVGTREADDLLRGVSVEAPAKVPPGPDR
jgi:hypothetical protein